MSAKKKVLLKVIILGDSGSCERDVEPCAKQGGQDLVDEPVCQQEVHQPVQGP